MSLGVYLNLEDALKKINIMNEMVHLFAKKYDLYINEEEITKLLSEHVNSLKFGLT